MLPKKRNNVQILLKSQESAQECWKCKIVLQIRKCIEKVPSAIGTAVIEVVVVVVEVVVLLVVVVEVLVVIEVMVVVVVVVVVVAAAEFEAAKELAVAVACVASSSGSIVTVAITQLFVFAVTWRVAFTNVMSFAHLSSAQYSNRHPCIEH